MISSFSTIRKPDTTVTWTTLPTESVNSEAKSTYWKDNILYSSSSTTLSSSYNSTSYSIQNTEATYSASLNWNQSVRFEYSTKAGHIYNLEPKMITGDRNRLFHCSLLQPYTTTRIASSSAYKWMVDSGWFIGVAPSEIVSHPFGDSDVYAWNWCPAVVSYSRYNYYPSGKTWHNWFHSNTWLSFANADSLYSLPRGSFAVNCNNPFYYTITNYDERFHKTMAISIPGYSGTFTLFSTIETTSGFASDKTLITKLANINKPFAVSMIAVGQQDVVTNYTSSFIYNVITEQPVVSSSTIYYMQDGTLTSSVSTNYIRRI